MHLRVACEGVRGSSREQAMYLRACGHEGVQQAMMYLRAVHRCEGVQQGAGDVPKSRVRARGGPAGDVPESRV